MLLSVLDPLALLMPRLADDPSPAILRRPNVAAYSPNSYQKITLL